ncbi:MAG: hypothetical protein E7580_04280 [Ruminococcaceae bacterium]|nr:hypothetical protein [Oscillospiraceae bacterium]
MKRMIALLCVLALCLPFASCASDLEQAAPQATAAQEESKTSVKQESGKKPAQKVENFKIPDELPQGFSVGYGRADITPEPGLPIYNGTGNSTHDPLMFTCTAISDGEGSVALLCSLDIKNITVEFSKDITDRIQKEFNVPADRVVLNVTHSHSTPNSSFNSTAALKWKVLMLNQAVVAINTALRDLDPVEGAYVGSGYTEGITFVRRYLLADGTYQTNAPQSSNPVAHESDADCQMRTIRIDRKNKKDVLMVNYQTHYGSATSMYKNQYSADFIHVFREEAEKKWDCHFVYHSGASGNLNFNSAIPGERKYSTFVDATKLGLIPTAESCLAGEEQVAIGPLRFASNWYKAPVYQDSPEAIEKAQTVNKQAEGSEAYAKALAENGFTSSRQIEGILRRASLGETLDVPFYAISFGDIGFVTAPYEMFDTNGVQVREGSPFKMTFVCSYSNGGFGYVPSALAFPHGAYEVFISRFCETTGDDFAVEMVRLLKECKAQG